MKIKIQKSQVETVEKAIAATKSDLQAMAEDFDLDPITFTFPKLTGQELEIAEEIHTVWTFINKIGEGTEIAKKIQAQLTGEIKEVIEMYQNAGESTI